MERKGYENEAHLVRSIRNWHRAVDGRGLSEAERSSYVQNMLEWLLQDWIPGYDETVGVDFRNLDVFRNISSSRVNGLTREVVVGLLANLTSLELCRSEYAMGNLAPEHPRSGTSDDVECFISMLHEMLGDTFDTKQFYESFPKIMNEFFKKIDSNSQFYYWTGRKHRFTDFPLQSFNKPSSKGREQLDITRTSKRSDPRVFCARRPALPTHNAMTVRTKFHKCEETLPIPPDPNQ